MNRQRVFLPRLVIALALLLTLGCRTVDDSPSTGTVFVTVTPPPPTVTPNALPIPLDETPELLLATRWAGEFKFDDQAQWVLVVADFIREASTLRVEVAFPLSQNAAPSTGPAFVERVDQETQIRFEIPIQSQEGPAVLTFAGQLADDKIVGQVSQGNHLGTFQLAPLADFAPDITEEST